jgi:methionine-rich copper-binding protein CopC
MPRSAAHEAASASKPGGRAAMTAPPHAIVIEASGPPDVAVGTDFMLRIKASCPAGCDLSGATVKVATPDGAAALVEPASVDPEAGTEFRKVALKAPLQPGEHVYKVSIPPHEVAGVCHDEGTLSVAVKTRPHATSLAVWAIPSPVVTGRRFAIKAGARSAAGCDLMGRTIEIRDESGAVMATGALGKEPWPGTEALYWTELELPAPEQAGMFSWSVNFEGADLAIPHESASSRFSIAIVRPPEHKLTVKVVERDTASPIADAMVRLGAYRGATDTSGLAEIMLPKGTFDLNVWKAGYEAPATTLDIDADATVEVVVAALPEENPDAAWLM